MLSLPDRRSVERAISDCTRKSLASLLAERLALSIDNGVAELTHYLVVEREDTEIDIVRAIGLSPFVNPIDGTRLGDPLFEPWWDWLINHHEWLEMIITVGNSGFAYVIFYEKK